MSKKWTVKRFEKETNKIKKIIEKLFKDAELIDFPMYASMIAEQVVLSAMNKGVKFGVEKIVEYKDRERAIEEFMEAMQKKPQYIA